ncbi:MAG: hypothetical protein PUC46_07315 [Lachnospiraceae bacterium]|jgi:hypothetical protein|nr:hypothetical protein [Lachnospiraceae bacterium]
MRFSEEQIRFLTEILHYDESEVKGPLEDMDEDFLLELGDRCFDVELEGDLRDEKKVPDACRIASDIYTMLNC